MNNKRKDQLLNLAFDETPEGEIVELSTDDRRELEALRTLKQDLKALRPTAECQVSVERIRDAILGQEIRSRRAWRPWVFGATVPVAAAILALFFLPRTSDIEPEEQGSPSIVARTVAAPEVQPEVRTTSGWSEEDARRAIASAMIAMQTLAPQVSATEPAPAAPRRVPESHAKRTVRPANRVTHQPVTKVTSAPTRSVTPPAPTAQPEPIVVISSTEDSKTGALRASEVESSYDVVIGG